MRNERFWIAAAFAFFTALIPLRPALADATGPVECGTIDTFNSTDKWVWATVYDTQKRTQLDWGWVAPLADRTWTAGAYACGVAYFARAQVKTNGQNTPDMADTTVQITPTTAGNDRACLMTTDEKSFTWNYADACGGGAKPGTPLPPGANFPATPASTSSCHDIYTYNATNNWIWVTIYDPLKIMHMDWGWVGPNSYRRWTGGGAPMGFKYVCTLPYYARAEVKAGGPANTPNVFDTIGQVKASDGDNLDCLKTDRPNHYYWDQSHWDATHSCMGNPETFQTTNAGAAAAAAIKAVALKLTDMRPLAVELLSAHVTPPYGPNSAVYRIGIVVGGKTQPPTLGTLGKWSTNTPDVIQLVDGAGGFRVLKPGAGVVFWNYGGKEYAVKIQAQ